MAKSKQRRTERRERVSAKRRVETHRSQFESSSVKLPDGMERFKLDKAGTYRIDVIPYKVGKGNPYADEGQLHYERTFFIHRGVSADNKTVLCLKKNFNKPCPVCEYRGELAKDPDVEDKVVKDMAPKERQLWNVVDKANPDKGVQLWDVSHHLFGKLLDNLIDNQDEGDGYEFFADPEDGFTLKLTVVEEKGQGMKYYEVAGIEFKPRSTPISDEILDQAVCLDDLLVELSAAELKKMLVEGSPSKDEDEDEEDESPRKSKPKPSKKSKPPVDEEDEDDDEEDDDEEDEDEDDDEEDDEEPAPKSKGKSKGKAIKVGDFVEHKTHGSCEVKHISNGLLRLEDDEGEIHRGIRIAEVALQWEDEEDEPASKSKPKKSKPPIDEDEDEEDSEFKVGQMVEFEYRGKTIQGKIVKCDPDRDLYHIKAEGRSNPHIVGVDDLCPIEDDEEDEDEDEPPKGKAKAGSKGGAKSSKKSKPPVDDEDEDEDEDEDDEDEDEDEDDEDVPF